METFNFPYHTLSETFPESGYGVRFGNSYQYRAAPSAPDQLVYTLSMSGLRYYKNTNGTFNRTINPQTNILFFRDFYNTHKQHARFLYPHQVEGPVVVRFSAPLKIPTAYEGGVVPAFEITLELQP